MDHHSLFCFCPFCFSNKSTAIFQQLKWKFKQWKLYPVVWSAIIIIVYKFNMQLYDFITLTVTIPYTGRLTLLQYITIKSQSNHDKLYIVGKVQDS